MRSAIAKVATNGGIRSLVIARPFPSPTTIATETAASTAGTPRRSRAAASCAQPTRAQMALRRSPPDVRRMTRVAPRVMTLGKV